MATTGSFDPDAFKDFEHGGWERAGEGYRRYFVEVTTQAVEPLLDAAGVTQDVRVLDVATGPGNAAAAAAARGGRVTGVDFSPAQVALARRINPGIDFQQGDAENLSFADGSFEAVIMNFGMLHFPRAEAALAEAHRVLAPGGRLAFTVWATPAEAVPFDILLGSVEAHGTLEIDLPAGPPMFRFSEADESSRTLMEAGFVLPQVKPVALTLRVGAPDDLFDFFAVGSVRLAALLDGQTAAARAAVRDAMRERVAAYERDGVYEMAMPCVLSSATRP